MVKKEGPSSGSRAELVASFCRKVFSKKKYSLGLITSWTLAGSFKMGALCHMAKLAKKFLASSNIPSMPWQGPSPNLNPDENAWNFNMDQLKIPAAGGQEDFNHEN